VSDSIRPRPADIVVEPGQLEALEAIHTYEQRLAWLLTVLARVVRDLKWAACDQTLSPRTRTRLWEICLYIDEQTASEAATVVEDDDEGVDLSGPGR
jgi:hypothetical protein